MKKHIAILIFVSMIISSCSDDRIIPYRKGDKWGYCNSNKKILIPCSYDNAYTFNNNLALVSQNGKYGFIDKTGKIIIPIIYDKAFVLGVERDLIFAVKNGRCGLIDCKGNVVMPVEEAYNDNDPKKPNWLGMYYSYSEEPFIKVENSKYGFVDRNGREVIGCNFDYANNFCEGLAKVSVSSTLIYYYLGQPIDYTIRKEGFIDKNGKQVIPCMYQESAGYGNGGKISISGFNFSNGRVKIMKNKKCGFMNRAGEETIPCIYDGCADFKGGYAIVENKNGENGYPKYGAIDTNGNQIIPCTYDFMTDFSEGLAKVDIFYKPKEKVGYIDIKGTQVIPVIYDRGENFSDGLALVTKEGQVGFIDKQGNVVIPFNAQYTNYEFGSFHDGLCMVLTISKNINDHQKVIGYIDKKGIQYWDE